MTAMPLDPFTPEQQTRLARMEAATPVDIAADVREDAVARAMYAEAMRRAVKHSRNSQAELRSAWNEAPDITRDWYLAVARAAISADPGPDTAKPRVVCRHGCCQPEDDTADQLQQRVLAVCERADASLREAVPMSAAESIIERGDHTVKVRDVRRAVAGPRRDEEVGQ